MTREIRQRQMRAFEEAARYQERRRGLGAPVRDAFFVGMRGGKTQHPLAMLLNGPRGSGGGRGGKTRILLYVSLLWVAGGGDHTTRRPARWWAELLGLPDAEGAGSRVVRSTWEELERRGFVSITHAATSGDSPTIRLLREDGSGDAYTIPVGRDGDTYRRVPENAWRTLFYSEDLTGPGLVMFLVALRVHGQAHEGSMTFPRAYFQSEYGLGDSTRKTGLRNLVLNGVLEAEGVSVEDELSGGRRRGRTMYNLSPAYNPPPRAVGTGTGITAGT